MGSGQLTIFVFKQPKFKLSADVSGFQVISARLILSKRECVRRANTAVITIGGEKNHLQQ